MVTSSTSVPEGGATDASDLRQHRPTTVTVYWRFARDYFFSERRWVRRGAVAALLALSAVQTLIQVRINLWNVDFFNALERRAMDEFFPPGIAVLFTICEHDKLDLCRSLRSAP